MLILYKFIKYTKQKGANLLSFSILKKYKVLEFYICPTRAPQKEN